MEVRIGVAGEAIGGILRAGLTGVGTRKTDT